MKMSHVLKQVVFFCNTTHLATIFSPFFASAFVIGKEV